MTTKPRWILSATCSLSAMMVAMGCTSASPDVAADDSDEFGTQVQAEGTAPSTLMACDTQAPCTMPLVTAGYFYSVMVRSDRTVWAWGGNNEGQLGNNQTGNSSSPVQVTGEGGVGNLTDIVAVGGGVAHTVAVGVGGSVWAWGRNTNGQLGDGSTEMRRYPVLVQGPGGIGTLSGVLAAGAGLQHSVALKADGTVWSWGDNRSGQLGNNSTTNSSHPVQVTGAGGSGWLEDVVAVAARGYHSIALKLDGSVWAWGANGDGQLGSGSTANSPVPVRVLGENGSGWLGNVKAVSAGLYHSVAVLGDGAIMAWGANGDGQLGIGGTTPSESSPVRVLSSAGVPFSSAAAVATANFSTFAVKNDGTAYGWGGNSGSHLGDGTSSTRYYPRQVLGQGGSGVFTGATAIASSGAANGHVVVLTTNGELWGWGNNAYGQIGDGTTQTRSTPVRIDGDPWKATPSAVMPTCQDGTCTNATGCVIEGTLHPWGPNPNNLCEVCTATSPLAWSHASPGAACESDNLECTTNECDGAGTCTHPLQPGFCIIHDVCISAGTVDKAGDGCQACIPAQSTEAYSDQDDGTECLGDGLECTANTCKAGVCDDSIIDGCRIDGDCIKDGAKEPGTEDCRACVPSVTRLAYSDLTGTPCVDDGKTCTRNVCASGECTHPLDSGWCYIEDECVEIDAPDPENDCKSCVPIQSTEEYTNTAFGAGCADDDNDCTANRCDGNGTCAHPVVKGCLIENACVADGGLDPTSQGCRICSPSYSTTAYTDQLYGTPCDDDGQAWTDDICDGHGLCTHPDRGECVIDGEVVADWTVKDGSPCEWCDSSKSPTSWSFRPSGSACDSDGVDWTKDVCDASGTCTHEPTGDCWIDGEPVAAGVVNTENECLWCNPSASASAWTPKAKGSPCLEDDLTCTRDECDGAGQCDHPLAEGCLIEGECVADRAIDPANNCLECNIVYSVDRYSPKADGESCDPNGACDGTGNCWPLLEGTCTIGGEEYANGEGNPANACQRCDSIINPDDWSNRTKGAACATDGLSCTSDACDGFGTCEHVLVVGCKIEGECVAPWAKNPGNACEECNPLVSSTNYVAGVAGIVCEDDEDASTQDICDATGICRHIPKGTCEIEGTKYDAGTMHPNSECQWCSPEDSPTSWSNRPVGTGCSSDQLACTHDACDAEGECKHDVYTGCLIDGACVGEKAMPLGTDCMECNPTLSIGEYSQKKEGDLCSSVDGDPTVLNVCDAEGGCPHPPKGICVIEGKTWYEGTSNPANGCLLCAPNKSKDSWTPKEEGSSCATDGLLCTTNECNKVGVCEHPLVSGCLIGDECKGTGAKSPSDECMVCDPSQSKTEYVESDTPECKVECTENEDCKEDEVCKEGKCEPKPACVEDKDCEDGEKCENGECRKVGCTENEQCGLGEECVDGECRTITEPDCTDDTGCESGEECVAGKCQPIGVVECDEENACGPGKECVAGKCEPIVEPGCKSDSDCPGQVCNKGKCEDPVSDEAHFEGGGCDCSAVGLGGGGRAGGSVALLSLFGALIGWVRRRPAR